MSEHDDHDGGETPLTPETEALLGAYVLDAVDDVERRRVEQLLAADAAARAEVDRLNTAADQLAEAAAEGASAPPELFTSLMARVAERPSAGALSAVSGDGVAPTSAPEVEPVLIPRSDVGTTAAASGEDPLPAVASFERHAARRQRLPWFLTAAAVVLLFVVGGIAVANRGGSDGPADAETAMQEMARTASTQPGSRTGELTNADGTASVEVVVDPQGHAFVLSGSLPALDAGSTYQLWGVDGGTPVSLGLLGSDPGTSIVGVDPEVMTLAITAEPAGGSAGPTTAPMMSGTLSQA